jgi:hypothetical protein
MSGPNPIRDRATAALQQLTRRHVAPSDRPMIEGKAEEVRTENTVPAGGLTTMQKSRLTRSVLARRMAHELLESNMDCQRAYTSLLGRFPKGEMGNTRRGLVRGCFRPRRVRLMNMWLAAALPHVQDILAEERQRAGNTVQAAYGWLALVMQVSPATFAKKDEKGAISFDLYQPHITDAMRAMIVSMRIKDGVITDIKLPDSTRALDQLIRLQELERETGGGTDNESIAKKIAERFQRARLVRDPSLSLPRPQAKTIQ